MWLQSLANMIEHEADASILAVTGQNEGRIKVSIMPCDQHGKEGPWDDDEDNDPFVDDPNDYQAAAKKQGFQAVTPTVLKGRIQGQGPSPFPAIPPPRGRR